MGLDYSAYNKPITGTGMILDTEPGSPDRGAYVTEQQLADWIKGQTVVMGYLYTDGVFYSDAGHTSPLTGKESAIYIDKTGPNDAIYRWDGVAYVALTEEAQVQAVITALQNGTLVPARATGDGDGNNIKNTYALKDVDAVIGNMAKFDASGNPIDAGFSALNTLKAIKITAQGTTLADIAAILNTVNGSGDHVVFDVSALGAGAYLCTIFMDGYPDATQSTVYKLFDLVTGKYAEGHYDGTTLLTMVLAISDTVATQGQIDYLQKEIDKIGGLNLITDYEALGKAIADGTSTDSISIGDTIEINWIKTVTGITTTAGNSVTCNDKNAFITQLGECEAKSYLFVFDGTNWTYNAEAITLSQWGLVFSGTPVAGEVMTITTTVTPVSYTFTSYDTIEPVSGNVAHNWLLEQTYAPSTKAYSTYESMFCVQEGKTIPAGKYYIPMYSYRSSKTFNACFTLSADMGAATKIQAKSNGGSSATTTDKDGNAVSGVYRPNSFAPIVYGTGASAGSNVSLSYLSDADASSGGYVLLTSLNVDVDDPVVVIGSLDKAALGNNCWADSNIRQWLNDDTDGDNFTPTYDNNIASAYNRGAGFLYGIDPRAKALIQTAKVKWTAGRENKNWTYNTTYTAEDKVFLLSMKEMSYNINTSEGLISQLYGSYTNNTLTNNNVAARAKYNKAGGTLNSYRWSRSAVVNNASSSWNVYSSGGNNNHHACNAHYFAPAFIFGKESA